MAASSSPWTSATTSQSGTYHPIQTSQVRLQTCAAAPEHLPLRDRLPVDTKLGGGLEATYNSKADFAGDSEAAEGRAEY